MVINFPHIARSLIFSHVDETYSTDITYPKLIPFRSKFATKSYQAKHTKVVAAELVADKLFYVICWSAPCSL